MTVAAIMAGLLPIVWSHGTGAEVMQRIAVPPPLLCAPKAAMKRE
jgi:Cu/Ag efflux pump CusA